MEYRIIQAIEALIDSGVCATYQSITNHLFDLDETKIGDRLFELDETKIGDRLWKMVRDGTLVCHDDEYWTSSTESGGYPAQPHYGDWLDAALTGMDPDGSQTSIQNPAIPKSQRPPAVDHEFTMLRSIRRNNAERKRKKRFRTRG